MKVKYRFADGEVNEVEVSDDIGAFILESRRREHADNERERYHSAHRIDREKFEDRGHFLTGGSPEERLISDETATELEDALSRLTPIQRRRMELLLDGESIARIAQAEGTSFNSVKQSVELAKRKLKKFLRIF